ncbi:hypothetical protein B0H16DRAFT_1745777 [Mycena metata]|uniref:Uncharacterized protein n=1 Tax=Mycena metata TaxID=1033252 RepID=A0AAD7MC08_9AGAR|nr:hypothetical protein B0H16DRAFT_1745777 [Mycena metata]
MYKGATSSAASGSGGTDNTPPDNIADPPSPYSTPAGTTPTPPITAPTAPSSPASTIPQTSTAHTMITSPPPPSGTNTDVASMATPRPSETDAYVTPPPTARQPLIAGPAPPGCPPDVPAWFSGAYAEMTATALGPHFNAVLAAWIRIEAASRYEHADTKLLTKHRPKQVGTWIARGRTKAADTTVRDPRVYAAQWQLWWDGLRPAWRTRDKDGVWSVTGEYGGSGKEWGALFQWVSMES